MISWWPRVTRKNRAFSVLAVALGGSVATMGALFAGPAGAASQGAVGGSSAGQMDITLVKQPTLQLSGSRDVVLSNDGAWSDSQTVCVAGQGIAGFRLSVQQAAPVAARAAFEGKPLGRGDLIPVRAEAVQCGAAPLSVLSLAGDGGGRSVMVLIVSPE